MNKFSKFVAVVAIALAAVGCTRVTDGESGVRVSFGGEYSQEELRTGWHQTVVGDVLKFPIRDLTVSVTDLKPLSAENSALADLDVNIVYSINPTSVAELYTRKARSFHAQSDGQVLLMHEYIKTLVNSAANKAIKKHKSLEVNDRRAEIETDIRDFIIERLKDEKLDTSVNISAVQIKNMLPNQEILKSATDLVKSQNDLKIKDNEIKIAQAEAERQKALSANAGQSIAYMNAQSGMMIAEAVKNGKVQTIIIPSNLTSLMFNK